MIKPTLDVRIPLSPTPSFYNRACLIIKSLSEFYDCAFTFYYTSPAGIELDDTINASTFTYEADVLWRRMSDSVTAQWALTNNKFAGGIIERFRPPFHADHVLLLDADVICCKGFIELFDLPPAISAVPAHVGPFGTSNASVWSQLYADFNVEPLPATHELTGYPFMTNNRYTPAYFNTGVVFAPASVFETISDSFFRAVEFVRTNMDTYFIDQVALTLALAAHPDIAVNDLAVKYNFPNDPGFDDKYADQLEQIKFLHFLRQGPVDRERDFESDEAIRKLCVRPGLKGSNKVFRNRIAELVGC